MNRIQWHKMSEILMNCEYRSCRKRSHVIRNVGTTNLMKSHTTATWALNTSFRLPIQDSVMSISRYSWVNKTHYLFLSTIEHPDNCLVEIQTTLSDYVSPGKLSWSQGISIPIGLCLESNHRAIVLTARYMRLSKIQKNWDNRTISFCVRVHVRANHRIDSITWTSGETWNIW